MNLTERGVIAVIRLHEPLPRAAAEAILAGGISVLELTLTTPEALESIAELRAAQPYAVIGAGSVLDAQQARAAVSAGAQFCVSPCFDTGVQALCREQKIPYLPGAFTPTELLTAHRAGVTALKLFPAKSLGPDGLRDLLAPLPFLRLVPSGGVSLANAAEWIRAGAVAVSVGSALLATANPDLTELTSRTRALLAAVRAAR